MAENTSAKLSTAPYKGVRDFYPRERFFFNYLTDIMRAGAESFGYEEYSASVLEPTELYAGKTSEEILREQTYTFTDRGGRSVTLRPEMTPTAARMVAARRRELSFPLRWYSLPNCFRYERPQKGRLREHWQLNCDLFGVAGVAGDAEILHLAHHLLQCYGAREDQFVIRVNHRALLHEALAALAREAGERLTPAREAAVLRTMDRRDKMAPDAYLKALEAAAGKALADAVHSRFTPEAAPAFCSALPSYSQLEALMGYLKQLGVGNARHDPFLVRGFDYYTGMVFEVYDTAEENPRALFGGGRYDRLLEMFGTEPIPAVGFGMGDVRIRDFLETHHLMPAYSSPTDLFVATVGAEMHLTAMQVAQHLREEGLNVAVNLTDRKVGAQIRRAADRAIPWVLVVGEEERTHAVYPLKHLPTGREYSLPLSAVAETILSLGK